MSVTIEKPYYESMARYYSLRQIPFQKPIPLEIKTSKDNVTRRLGQVPEAIAYGYDKAALITTLSKAKKNQAQSIRQEWFHSAGSRFKRSSDGAYC
jgi:hypothetical protein